MCEFQDSVVMRRKRRTLLRSKVLPGSCFSSKGRPRIYVPNLSHAETRSLKPSRAKVGSMRGVKQPLTLSRTTGVAISTWNKRVDETVGEEKDKSVN